MEICKFCSNEYSSGQSIIQHERLCPKNENRDSRHATMNKGRKWPENRKIPAARIISDDQRSEASKKSKEINRLYWTAEQRQIQSDRMKAIVLANPESYSAKNVCGRNKQVEYNGVKLNSSWELIAVNWFNEHDICWERNITGFPYFWPETNRTHTYFPDFYLPEVNVYVEIKGYETSRDFYKWAAVENLVVFKKNEISSMKSGTF